MSWRTFAHIETVPGRLVTSSSTAKVVAPQQGVVASSAVKEGQRVERGDRLLVINSGHETAEGGDVAGRSLGAIAAHERSNEAQVAMAEARAAADRARLSGQVADHTRTVLWKPVRSVMIPSLL